MEQNVQTTSKPGELNTYWKYVQKTYKLRQVLGNGTFGEVVKGKHRETKKEVAIKFIKGRLNTQPKVRTMIRELSIMRQLSSMRDNFFTVKLLDVIVAVKDGGSLSDCHGVFLVMNYIEDDLKKTLDGVVEEQFREDHIKVIIYNTLCCLNFIHTANLMHRDIKPQNIMMTTNCIPTLIDFGIARTVEPQIHDTMLDKSNNIDLLSKVSTASDENDLDQEGSRRRLSIHVQSRWYRAPEVILANETYDSQVDLWGLGCILGEMLLLSQTNH